MKCDTSCKSVAFGNVKPKQLRRGNQQEKIPEFDGFIVIRLSQRYAYLPGDNLYEFCKEHKLMRFKISN
jgi:hypothetical protein